MTNIPNMANIPKWSLKRAETKLTAKQEAFCIAYALDGMMHKQAYITAYGRGNKNNNSLDVAVCRLLKTSKIIARCKELKASVQDKVIWAKVDMINSLKEITAESLAESGADKYNAKRVAVNAIKVASDILGYKAPDKLEIDTNQQITINIVGKNMTEPRVPQDPMIVGEYTPPINERKYYN